MMIFQTIIALTNRETPTNGHYQSIPPH